MDHLISNLFDLSKPVQAFQALRRQQGHFWDHRQKIAALHQIKGSNSSNISEMRSPRLESVFDFSDAPSTTAISEPPSEARSGEGVGGLPDERSLALRQGSRSFQASRNISSLPRPMPTFKKSVGSPSPPSEPRLVQEHFPTYNLNWEKLAEYLKARFPHHKLDQPRVCSC